MPASTDPVLPSDQAAWSGQMPVEGPDNTPRLVVIAGPTASGKTALALDVAERLGGEIINGDALQLYRGMDIGTAKIPEGERRGIPHHLFDHLDVTETATVAGYQVVARERVEEILARGRHPILVGGSGLYLQAVADELRFPPTDPDVRACFEAELAAMGPNALHARLTAVDPLAAANIEPLNGRKTVRALEVISLTGQPFSAFMPVSGPFRYRAVWFCIDRPTADLDDRVESRVDVMIESGLEAEVRRLDAQGLRSGVTAARALGYQQMLDVIDGKLDLTTAAEQIVQGTKRYVRRQRSWFRRDRRQIWLSATDPDLVATVVGVIRGTVPVDPSWQRGPAAT